MFFFLPFFIASFSLQIENASGRDVLSCSPNVIMFLNSFCFLVMTVFLLAV